MEKELREFAEQLGITKRVRFLGTRHDVPNLLATADVYVTATRYEGLAGYALLEAALAGCRIVASDIPEIREVFDDMPGEFVTVGAPSEIVEGVKRAIASGDHANTIVADHVSRLFDRHTIGCALTQAYRLRP